MQQMRILFLGEIVGSAGVHAVRYGLPEIRTSLNISYVIANGDGAVNGAGLGKSYTLFLRKLGINLITGGDACYTRKDFVENIDSFSHVIRPANYDRRSPGRGLKFFSIDGKKYLCINVLGQAWQNRNITSNVISTIDRILHSLKNPVDGIFVDMHSYSTAEKQTVMYAFQGKITAFFGTGQRILTNDLRILQQTTATITDSGLCGSQTGIGGMEPQSYVQQFLTGIPRYHKSAFQDIALQGVYIDVEDGKCTNAEYLEFPVILPDKKGAMLEMTSITEEISSSEKLEKKQ